MIKLKQKKQIKISLGFILWVVIVFLFPLCSECNAYQQILESDTFATKNVVPTGYHKEYVRKQFELLDESISAHLYCDILSVYNEDNWRTLVNETSTIDATIDNAIKIDYSGSIPSNKRTLVTLDGINGVRGKNNVEQSVYTNYFYTDSWGYTNHLNATTHYIPTNSDAMLSGYSVRDFVAYPWGSDHFEGANENYGKKGYNYCNNYYAYSTLLQKYIRVSARIVWFGDLTGRWTKTGYEPYDPVYHDVLTYNLVPNSYTVRYESNGGGTYNSMNYFTDSTTYDEDYTVASCKFTAPAGMQFDHWEYTDKNGNTKTTKSGDTLLNLTDVNGATVTLKAIYVGKTYTIVYQANGGTGSVTDQTFTYTGSTQTITLKPNTYINTGYKDAGWSNTTDGSGYIYKGGTTVYALTLIKDASVGTTIWLNAQWTNNSYFLCYNYDDLQSSGYQKESVLRDVYVTIKNPTDLGFAEYYTGTFYSDSGFRFAGWNNKLDYTGSTYYYPTLKNAVAVGEVYNLYGVWCGNITYNKNYNSAPESAVSQTIFERNDFIPIANSFKNPTGYQFDSWNTKADGSGESFYAGKTYDRWSYQYLNMNRGNGSLFAKWKPISYTIRFNANGSSGKMDDLAMTYGVPAALPACAFPVPAGKNFAGWKDIFSGITYTDRQSVNNLASIDGEVVTLTAQWTNANYTVKFDANGGSGSMAKQILTCDTAQTLNACTFTAPSGKKFKGWNTKADGAGTPTYQDKQSVTNLTTSGNTITLYAQWESAGSYTIRFHANSGMGSMADYKAVCGVPFTLPENQFSKYGYEFYYWSTSQLYVWNSKKYSDHALVDMDLGTADSMVMLYAHWSEDAYDVVYDANGSSGHMDMDCWNYTEDWQPQDNAFAVPAGKNFAGWNTKPDGSGMSFDPGTSYNDARDNFIKNYTTGYSDTSDTVLTLYAQWVDSNYTIIYDDNGAAGLMDDQIVVRDAAAKLSPNQYEKYFNEFQGWNTKADGTGTSYTDNADIMNLCPAGEIITLYAQWENYIRLNKGRFILVQDTFMSNGKVIYDIKSKFADTLPEDTKLELQTSQERYENKDYLLSWYATTEDIKRFKEDEYERRQDYWECFKWLTEHMEDYIHIIPKEKKED